MNKNTRTILISLVFLLVASIIFPDDQNPLTQPEPTPTPIPTPTVQNISREQALVTKVVDGDTIHVLLNNEDETVRIIGINTPETVDPRKEVECFGIEASTKAKELLMDKIVYLESDDSQSNRDRYDRILRYIFLEDETDYGKLMIENGYAYEYTYDMPYRYQEHYQDAQITAAGEKRGLWGDQCNNL